MRVWRVSARARGPSLGGGRDLADSGTPPAAPGAPLFSRATRAPDACPEAAAVFPALARAARCPERAGSPSSLLHADPREPGRGLRRKAAPKQRTLPSQCSLQPCFHSEQEFPLLLRPGRDPPDVNNALTLTKCYFGTGVNCNLYSAAFYAGKRTHPNGSQLATLGC